MHLTARSKIVALATSHVRRNRSQSQVMIILAPLWTPLTRTFQRRIVLTAEFTRFTMGMALNFPSSNWKTVYRDIHPLSWQANLSVQIPLIPGTDVSRCMSVYHYVQMRLSIRPDSIYTVHSCYPQSSTSLEKGDDIGRQHPTHGCVAVAYPVECRGSCSLSVASWLTGARWLLLCGSRCCGLSVHLQGTILETM